MIHYIHTQHKSNYLSAATDGQAGVGDGILHDIIVRQGLMWLVVFICWDIAPRIKAWRRNCPSVHQHVDNFCISGKTMGYHSALIILERILGNTICAPHKSYHLMLCIGQ